MSLDPRNEVAILNFTANKGLPLTSLIWAVAVLAALGAGLYNGTSANTLLPYAGIALLPALAGLVLWPFSRREWAQMVIIFSWIALAIAACFAISFIPMAVLFLCAPAAAALFEREKVIEAMVLSAIFAAIVFYAPKFGYAPEPIANLDQINWGQLAGIMATIAFMIGAMFFAANDENNGDVVSDPDLELKAGFADAYPGAALKFSPDGVLVMASKAAMPLFGLSERDLGEMSSSNLLVGDDETETILQDAFEKARTSDEAVNVQISSTLDENDDGPANLEIDLVAQPDGSVFAFATDNTQKTAEFEALENLQSSVQKEAAEKTLFFAGVSHELRTPLNAIIGFSDMMRSRLFGPLPGKYAEYADLIHDSGQHMLDLIGDVLDMSKVEAGKYELHYGEFDIADVIRSSMKMVRPSADAASLILDAEIDAGQDLVIEADRKAIRQILLNLLSNSIKFTPKGGRVVVSAKIVADVLNLSVEDNGMGMSADDLRSVGTPFNQAKNAQMIDARGSGLGLSLVKNLVELHKGRFAMTSHPGAGTSVNIYLPVHRPGGDV